MVSKYEILSNQKDPKILTGSPKPFLVKSSMLDLEIFIPDHKTFPKMQKKLHERIRYWLQLICCSLFFMVCKFIFSLVNWFSSFFIFFN